MRRVLASLLVIVALSASAFQLAYAVFSDSESIEGNTISTGAVDIDINLGENPTPITASGLMPGEWSDWYRYLITNNSEEHIKLYFYVTDVDGDACDKTLLDIRTGVEGSDESERSMHVYNSGLTNIMGVDNKVEITGHVFDPSMLPDDRAAVQMRAGLDLSATNDDANEECSWTGVFFAEGTPETPVSSPVSFPEDVL